MSSDSEPEAKRVKIVENNDDAVKVSAFEGEIEALISQDHPKHRYGELPDGFSKLVMSPTNRYGAEIQVYCESHSSLVVDECQENTMVRIVDFASLTYTYFWLKQRQFHKSRVHVKSVYWINDQDIILVFGQNFVDDDGVRAEIEYGKYRIDHQLKKMKEVWKIDDSTEGSEFSFCIPGVLAVNDEQYFVLIDGDILWFMSITKRKFLSAIMFLWNEQMNENECVIQGGFLYYLKYENDDNYLVRVNLADIDFSDSQWLNTKLDNNEYEEIKISWHLNGHMFSTYNKNYILLQWVNYADKFMYYLVDLRNFTWKELSFRGNRDDAVKVAAFEGEIEALISQDHPKHRYGEMPDGFSKLVMSPTNRYGAEIQVYDQPQSPLVVEKSQKSAMVRIVDFATLTYRYYWLDQTDFHYSKYDDCSVQTLFTAVYWLDDENLILVFCQTSVGDRPDSTLDYGLYKIDRQLEKLERVWYKWEEMYYPTYLRCHISDLYDTGNKLLLLLDLIHIKQFPETL